MTVTLTGLFIVYGWMILILGGVAFLGGSWVLGAVMMTVGAGCLNLMLHARNRDVKRFLAH